MRALTRQERRWALKQLRPMIDELKVAVAEEREQGRTDAEFAPMFSLLELKWADQLPADDLKAVMAEIREAARPPHEAPEGLQ